MTVFVGIDLGTTYSAIAAIDENGYPKIIHNKDGQNITASCVAEQDGVVEVGELAQKTWGAIADGAAARFKRAMGTSQKFWVNGTEYTPTELSALVLKKLKQDAEAQLGNIHEAVVTIPANFAHEAREATIAAAKSVGLNVKYIINEPTAAALYYAYKNGSSLDGTYAVYDMGGGTFDVSVIKAKGHVVEVLSSNGVSKLGGDDFESALMALIQKKWKRTFGEELKPSELTKNQAESEKKALSSRNQTKISINGKQIEVTRAEFEEAISSLIAQAEMLCESTVEEAGIDLSDIAGVFLVGGSTRIPCIKESVKRVFRKEPQSTVNVDEVVALGAAVYAAYKGDRTKLTLVQNKSIEKVKVEEVTAKCFGTLSQTHDSERDERKLENAILIEKGSRIPCSVTKSFYTVREGQEAVNCIVTESTSAELDPRFVTKVWEGELHLPANRPASQEIRVTFSYDANQIMKCSFLDVGTGREKSVDLSMAAASTVDTAKINKFLVE